MYVLYVLYVCICVYVCMCVYSVCNDFIFIQSNKK